MHAWLPKRVEGTYHSSTLDGKHDKIWVSRAIFGQVVMMYPYWIRSLDAVNNNNNV